MPDAPPEAAAALFTLEHDGSPDLTVAAEVVTLGPDPLVLLKGHAHALVAATPDAGWIAAPLDPVTNHSPGWYVRQSTLDTWAVAGGKVTAYLRAVPNLLGLSVIPLFFANMLTAWTTCGRLSLSKKYNNEEWMQALSRAGLECDADPRVALIDTAFFKVQPRVGSTAVSFAADRSFMYEMSGELLFSEDDHDTFAAAFLMKGASPRNTRAGRDAVTDIHCRFMLTLRSIAGARSSSFRDALSTAAIESNEEAEYVVDTWKMLVRTGYPFAFGTRISQRNMELDRASRIAFGTSAEQEVAFREIFPGRLCSYSLLRRCVEAAPGAQNMHSSLEAFEQIAEMFYPGASWTNFTMVSSVERELGKILHTIDSWGQLSVVERLGSIRDCLKQATVLTEAKSDADDGSHATLNGVTGLEAVRSKEFMDTSAEIATLSPEDFMKGLDCTNYSKSKVWRMVGYGMISKKVIQMKEIESMSKFLPRWPQYLPMVLATKANGKINKDMQGKDVGAEVIANLLSGKWHKVPWVKLMQWLDLWCDDVQIDVDCNITDEKQGYAALCMAKTSLLGTMELLQLASVAEAGEQTVTSFIGRIIGLERRSRALPAGSVQRQLARSNYAEAYYACLKECGARWAGQWKTPVNFTEPMFTTFSSTSCFFNHTLDHLESVANQLYQLRDTGVCKGLTPSSEGKNPRAKKRTKDDSSSDDGEEASASLHDELSPGFPSCLLHSMCAVF